MHITYLLEEQMPMVPTETITNMADERSGSEKSENNKSAKSVREVVDQITIQALQNLILTERENGDPNVINTDDDDEDDDDEDEDGLVEGGTQLPSTPADDQLISQNEEIDDDLSDDVDDSGMDIGGDTESEEGENEEQPDSDLIVLDPEHPLMKRFQKAYKEHLQKQDEKVTLELRELREEQSNSKKRREELGVELYEVQQELARQQMQLERQHDQFNEKSEFRKHCETRLNEIKTLYKQAADDLQHRRKKANELQTEVENVASKLLYVEAIKTDVRSDISILKRAAEKAETEVMKAQREKQTQDLLVNKLVSTVDHLRGDIAMYEAQIKAQREETKAATRTLTEASTELEAIDLEKKQLLQQWNNSLIGMKRRDESYIAIQDAVNIQKQQIMAIDTELDGYKRQILKAQEQNEQLTYMYNRIENDIISVKKQITIVQNKHEALKIEYSTYSRTLHDTEQFLSRAQLDVTLKESELVNLQKLIEKEFLDKVKIEDMIMSKMQEQLTAEKASQYTKKMTNKIRRKATQLERSVAEIENEISTDVLEVAHAAMRVRNLQDILSNINSVIDQKNETISKIENEIVKRNAAIEKKQGMVDQFSKKIELHISKEGNEAYTGPLEFQIKTLQRQIETTSNDCLELQQYWLRQQGELVKVVRQVASQSTEIDAKKKQSTVLLQKKLRIEGEINSEKNEISDIERSVRSMQNDMTKLNLLIHKNRDKQETLQQDNILLENDFVSTLRDAELKSIQMQNSITGLNEEKERLLNALVEAERQIMLWEKKTQLAREARDAVDADIGHGEMHVMKAEIHRMEVRYAQLLRQQEKMIQDMEKSVFKRESIIVRGDAQAKMERKKLGKPKENKGTFHKKVAELKKKIKQTNQDANACEEEIKRLREYQQDLSGTLEEKQSNGQQLQQSVDMHEGEVERMVELKQKNLNEIIKRQQKAKHYTSLKGGKYTPFCKTPTSLNSEREKQKERFQSLSTIVDRLNSEYPEMQTALRDVTLTIGGMVGLTERSSRSVLEVA